MISKNMERARDAARHMELRLRATDKRFQGSTLVHHEDGSVFYTDRSFGVEWREIHDDPWLFIFSEHHPLRMYPMAELLSWRQFRPMVSALSSMAEEGLPGGLPAKQQNRRRPRRSTAAAKASPLRKPASHLPLLIAADTEQIMQAATAIQEQRSGTIRGRRPKLITVNGQSLSIREWTQVRGFAKNTIEERIRSGWDPVTAVMTPPMKRGRAVSRNEKQLQDE